LLESVYETVLAYELERRGVSVARQVSIPIRYADLELTDAFRADLVVENLVIVELKSVESVNDLHKKQLLTYLKLSGKRLGLLVNFGSERIKTGITRIVNQLPET
jgi:GxxExxY protein